MAYDIVIAGGGIAALEAAVALRTLGGDAVSPVVITPSTELSFRAHEVGEPFGKRLTPRIPLTEVLDDLSMSHICSAIAGVDRVAGTVLTVDGSNVPYDGLLVAVGATPFPAYTHGISFDRRGDPDTFDELLSDVEQRLVSAVAFVVPEAAGWTMPAYDLALMLSAWTRRRDIEVDVRIVTAESSPLECFGSDASRCVAQVLERAGVTLVCGTEPVLVSDTLMTASGHWIGVDRIVSLPRLAGPRVRGLPCDSNGFIEVDTEAAVPGCAGVYAAGDGTAHTRKQGGLAAQQADQAARGLLRHAGLRIPGPPALQVLRGALATPDGPLFLEACAAYGSARATSIATLQPLWDPPGKVATRWLGPFLEGMTQRRLAAFAA